MSAGMNLSQESYRQIPQVTAEYETVFWRQKSPQPLLPNHHRAVGQEGAPSQTGSIFS